jgi:hypothetical protein
MEGEWVKMNNHRKIDPGPQAILHMSWWDF